MTEPLKMVEWRILPGAPVEANGLRITPEARSLILSLPFFRFVWNRPVAITVEVEGKSERIPIVDVTRMVLLAIAASAGLFALVVGLAKGRKEKKSAR